MDTTTITLGQALAPLKLTHEEKESARQLVLGKKLVDRLCSDAIIYTTATNTEHTVADTHKRYWYVHDAHDCISGGWDTAARAAEEADFLAASGFAGLQILHLTAAENDHYCATGQVVYGVDNTTEEKAS